MIGKRIMLGLFWAIVPGVASLYGWSSMHATITEAAFEALPEKQKQVWSTAENDSITKATKPISQHLINSFSAYPDQYDCGPQSPGFIPGVEPYIYRDKGKRSYHYFAYTEAQNRTLCCAGAKWYFQKMAESFKANKPLDAARYAGAFAHAIEDRTSPYHALDGYEKVRAEYDKKYNLTFAFWTLNDSGVKLALEGYQPQCLGKTPAEAADAFTKRFEEINLNARNFIETRFIEAHLKDDWQNKTSGTDTDEIMRVMAEPAAKLIADAWYTGFMIAPEKQTPPRPAGPPTPPVNVPLPNAGAEKPLDAKLVGNYKSDAATAEFSIGEGISHSGRKSFHIVNTSTPTDPPTTPQNAMWIIHAVPAIPDRTYKISAWVKTADVKKAYISVRHTDGNGNYITEPQTREADAVTGTSEWKQIKTEVNTPVDGKGFDIFLCVADQGEAWFDDVEVWAVDSSSNTK